MTEFKDQVSHDTYEVPARMSGAYCEGKSEYDRMYRESIENPSKFWGDIASQFYWKKQWGEVSKYNLHMSKGAVDVKWFVDGITNICYNAVDRHIYDGKADKVAFLWEDNEPGNGYQLTYKQTKDKVCKMANLLKSMGVKKGDRVALYMPMVMELPIAMLACARIGAIHSVVFGGFSAHALADRIIDCEAEVLLTADGTMRGAKPIHLKKIADEAIALTAKENKAPKKCIVVKVENYSSEHTAENVGPFVDGLHVKYEDVIDNQSNECEVEWVDSEHPLFLLYTSGSTGKPKGVLHTTGGYMVYAATTTKYTFDPRENDVFWCTADCGWITGHTYITYGPLLHGVTNVVFNGVPTFPDAGRFWQICSELKVTQFYTAPTAIRALKAMGDKYVTDYDLSSLRVLGTVGEPINPEAWKWYYDVVGKKQCAIVDTYWQTETGGHIMTPLPGASSTRPGSCTGPSFGIDFALIDNDGKIVEGQGEGFVVIAKPWPGMMRTVYKNHPRYEKTYFSQFDGYYCTGDGGYRDENGFVFITGRVDDVMSVSGHRIGTAEVESAISLHPKVSETSAVQVPHDIKGHAIICYVVMKNSQDTVTPEMEKELKKLVASEVGAFARPDHVYQISGLPKTRSGKIMRRILRKIEVGEYKLGDTSTLADPTVVDQLIKEHQIRLNGPTAEPQLTGGLC